MEGQEGAPRRAQGPGAACPTPQITRHIGAACSASFGVVEVRQVAPASGSGVGLGVTCPPRITHHFGAARTASLGVVEVGQVASTSGLEVECPGCEEDGGLGESTPIVVREVREPTRPR